MLWNTVTGQFHSKGGDSQNYYYYIIYGLGSRHPNQKFPLTNPIGFLLFFFPPPCKNVEGPT